MQNKKNKQKTKQKGRAGKPTPFFYAHTGPNNLLQIYNNAKNIKNRRKI